MHHVLFLRLEDIMLSTRECLEYDIIDPAPHQRHVDAHCLQVLAKG